MIVHCRDCAAWDACGDSRSWGECRRGRPDHFTAQDGETGAIWPVTQGELWCLDAIPRQPEIPEEAPSIDLDAAVDVIVRLIREPGLSLPAAIRQGIVEGLLAQLGIGPEGG